MLNALQSSVSKHNKNTENPGFQQMNNASQKSDTLSIFLIFEDNFVLTWIRQSYRNVVLSYCQLCGLNSYEAHLCIFFSISTCNLYRQTSLYILSETVTMEEEVFCHACLYEHVACKALILFELQLPAGYQA